MSLTNLQTKVGVTTSNRFDPETYKAAAAFFKLSKFRAAHFFGQCAHESGNFTVFSENLNYSAKGLRGTFGKYFPGDLSETYAKQPQRIANRAYANRNGNGPESSGDGWKFRGRGAIQLTGRSNYQLFSNYLKDPEVMTNPDIVATKYSFESALFFFDNNNLWRISDEGVNSDTILRLTKRINGGTNGLSDRQEKTYKFLKYETVPFSATQRELPSVQNIQTGEQTNQNQSQEPISQEKTGSDTQDTQQQAAQGPIEQIKQIFPPTLKPSEISIELKGTSEADKQNIAQTMGFNPTLFYNGVQISATSMINFKLSHESLVPRIDATIFDTYGLFKKSGIPGDGTIISLFLSSRSKYLKSIRIDFKIIDFKELSGSKYRLSAIINAPKLYTKQFTSLTSMSTLEALKEISKQCGLGFSTNINTTNDRQNWINIGESYLDFIKKIVDKSYISDQSFQVCYIDYYYNLVYVDLSKEFDRNINEDVGITGTGFDELTKGSSNRTDIDDKISPLILTTDRNLGMSTNFIDKFKTVNNSTAISVSQAYRNEIKYLDLSKKELLYFKNDPQTSDASKNQVLRATAGNDEFFNEHTASTYTGKIDGFEDSGNSHTNIGFTSVNNKRNLIELSKYSAKSILPKYNFNLYPFRKVAVQVIPMKQTPDQPEGFDVRLTGEWLITGLEFRWNQNGASMQADMIKRDLSLSPNEQSEDLAPKNDQNNFKTESNPSNDSGTGIQSTTQSSTEQPQQSQVGDSPSEFGEMAPKVPGSPSDPGKSSPSNYPIKPGSYRKTERTPTQIILHYSAGWQRLDRCQSTYSTLNDRGLTYHYIISVDGHIENLVDPKYIAYHASDANPKAIGISIECLGTTFANKGSVQKANAEVDKYRKNAKYPLYSKCQDYVQLVNFNNQPTTYRGSLNISQEVSDAQIRALEGLLKSLKNRFKEIPSWTGLTPENFNILFPPSGTTWKSSVPGLYTHCSITTKKADILPTPKMINFLKRLRY